MNVDFDMIFDTINLNQIPEIQLYMDQITTFMDDKLSGYKRTDSDKIITKTMINNYTKDKILPAPEKKKYSPSHLMLLIIIFHLKHVLSITDIGKIINSMTEKEIDTRNLYEIFTKIQESEKDIIHRDIDKMYEKIESLTPSLNSSESKEIKLLLLVLYLSFDAAAKKIIAESIIDNHFTN